MRNERRPPNYKPREDPTRSYTTTDDLTARATSRRRLGGVCDVLISFDPVGQFPDTQPRFAHNPCVSGSGLPAETCLRPHLVVVGVHRYGFVAPMDLDCTTLVLLARPGNFGPSRLAVQEQLDRFTIPVAEPVEVHSQPCPRFERAGTKQHDRRVSRSGPLLPARVLIGLSLAPPDEVVLGLRNRDERLGAYDVRAIGQSVSRQLCAPNIELGELRSTCAQITQKQHG